MTEEEIAGLFERVAPDLDLPQIDALVSGAERGGRRLRHRRRALLAAGTVLTVAAIALAVTTTGALPRLTGAPGGNPPATGASPSPTAAEGTGSPSPTASASRSPAPSPVSTPSPGAASSPMTDAQIMTDLRGMLPATATISDVQDEPGEAVDFNYNDGQGNAYFSLSISGPSPGGLTSCSQVDLTNEGTRPAGALPASCAATTLSDGSVLLDIVTGNDQWGLYDYNVRVIRPDGTTIILAVGNGTIGQTSASPYPTVTRAVPPGSLAQWNAIVENPVWES